MHSVKQIIMLLSLELIAVSTYCSWALAAELCRRLYSTHMKNWNIALVFAHLY
jgi:hypothetical protein